MPGPSGRPSGRISKITQELITTREAASSEAAFLFGGANVTEMIAEVVAARKLETTGHEIIKSVHPHPTMSEAVMEATAAAYDEVIHL